MRKASNNDLKLLRKLNRKKYREKEQLFMAEGERTVEQIIENGLLEVVRVFVNQPEREIFAGKDTTLIDKETFAEIADTENTQGVLALCRMPREAGLSDFTGGSGLLIATDAIQDPGNMGTIIRTASWFGAGGLLAGKGSTDVYHPKVVRSTAGATGSLPVAGGDADAMLSELEEAGWQIYLLDGGPESVSLEACEVHPKSVLVVGNEANGIQPSLIREGRILLGIRSAGGDGQQVESLNAAVALSIALNKFAGA